MVWECAFQMCDRNIDITMDEYLLIVPDHFIGDIERIVAGGRSNGVSLRAGDDRYGCRRSFVKPDNRKRRRIPPPFRVMAAGLLYRYGS